MESKYVCDEEKYNLRARIPSFFLSFSPKETRMMNMLNERASNKVHDVVFFFIADNLNVSVINNKQSE
jgi:hypothetical protein